MIWKTKIQLQFPLGASFSHSPAVLVYSRVLQMLRKASCMVSQSRCQECPSNGFCRYYWLTGDNFQTYPGVLSQVSMTDQKIFAPGEELSVFLYWIGQAQTFSVLVEPALNSMNQMLAGQPCIVRNVTCDPVEPMLVQLDHLQVRTPLRKTDLIDEMKQMSQSYSSRYGEEISVPQTEMTMSSSLKIDAGLTVLPTRKIRLIGSTGNVQLNPETEIDSRWLAIGIGKENCIGGGQLAVDSDI